MFIAKMVTALKEALVRRCGARIGGAAILECSDVIREPERPLNLLTVLQCYAACGCQFSPIVTQKKSSQM